jgi:5-methyltetrahydropteroyltriglutamate--homocysteine methyltransferase
MHELDFGESSSMSQSKNKPPYRAEHVGSLLRPNALREARARVEGDYHATTRGSIRFKQLESLENDAIVDAIRLQEEIGLQSITDGEFRRRSWWQDFVLELGGTYIGFADFALEFTDPQGHKLPAPVAHVDAKIRRTHGITTDSFKFLKAHTKRTPKITMPSPPVVHFFGGNLSIDKTVYSELEEFWADLARAYREEIQDLAALGCKYIQLDECIFALMCDPKFQSQLRARGDDPDALLRTYTKVINSVLKDRPNDVTFAMHLCRGNNRGHWLAEGGYDFISEVLFNEIDVDAYFMEYDSPRAGDFRPLRQLPRGKTVVLGLVTTKTPKLESEDDIKRRIDEAAAFAPLDRLALSPQCGFASHFIGNPLSVDDERRKLELVVKVADDVWGDA